MAASDEALLARALKSGDRNEIAKVFERIYLDYFKLVAFVIGGFIDDLEAIKDLTQDVFVKFFSSPHGVKDQLRPYLCAIARNVARDYLRESWRSTSLSDPEMVVDESGQSAEFYAKLVEDLRALLSPREVEIILLHANGYTFAQIAKRLNISASNANVICFRAIKRFRENYRR